MKSDLPDETGVLQFLLASHVLHAASYYGQWRRIADRQLWGRNLTVRDWEPHGCAAVPLLSLDRSPRSAHTRILGRSRFAHAPNCQVVSSDSGSILLMGVACRAEDFTITTVSKFRDDSFVLIPLLGSVCGEVSV
ncbi:hypothetical protein X731_31980 [Mesorhizobium sp. L2C054A000]|nr:hypothetical protein X731_31980 [Mesorhizobium sp. L2C054A000]